MDIIEAGFPFASPDDFAAVQQIAKLVGNEVDDNGYVPVICGLSRTKTSDLECAWDAVRHAKLPRVHTFIATSPIHMEYKLRMTEDQVVENAVAAVRHLKSLGCDDIEFSPEDAGRSEPRFLYRVLEAVIEAGATTLNIPDTTGWNMPAEFGGLIADLRANTPGAASVVFSTHCQNDLGLSTANSLAGAVAGARQIECTINGIGERAGNASLEEVVMAIALRGADELGGLRTGINTRAIFPTSRMVSDFTGMIVQPHKAVVGANAFAHESGIHQDGMLKNANTYEIMTPESIGMSRAEADVGVVLGKHSGRNALRTKLAALGVTLEGDSLDEVFKRFKDLCDKKKRVQEEDVLALVSDEVSQVSAVLSCCLWRVRSAPAAAAAAMLTGKRVLCWLLCRGGRLGAAALVHPYCGPGGQGRWRRCGGRGQASRGLRQRVAVQGCHTGRPCSQPHTCGISPSTRHPSRPRCCGPDVPSVDLHATGSHMQSPAMRHRSHAFGHVSLRTPAPPRRGRL